MGREMSIYIALSSKERQRKYMLFEVTVNLRLSGWNILWGDLNWAYV